MCNHVTWPQHLSDRGRSLLSSFTLKGKTKEWARGNRGGSTIKEARNVLAWPPDKWMSWSVHSRPREMVEASKHQERVKYAAVILIIMQESFFKHVCIQVFLCVLLLHSFLLLLTVDLKSSQKVKNCIELFQVSIWLVPCDCWRLIAHCLLLCRWPYNRARTMWSFSYAPPEWTVRLLQ